VISGIMLAFNGRWGFALCSAGKATAATSWYPDYPTVMNLAKNAALGRCGPIPAIWYAVTVTRGRPECQRSAADEWRADVWDMIARCPDLDWLLLSKRPQNIRRMLRADWGEAGRSCRYRLGHMRWRKRRQGQSAVHGSRLGTLVVRSAPSCRRGVFPEADDNHKPIPADLLVRQWSRASARAAQRLDPQQLSRFAG
jgi:hypothetical protein